MKLNNICVTESTLRKVRSAIVAGAGIIIALCSIPVFNGRTGQMQEKQTLYKIEEQQLLAQYEWVEILNPLRIYEIQDTYETKDGIREYDGFKAFESTNQITKYRAGDLNAASETDKNGFQKVNDRYLVAIGSRFDTEIGQYFDVVLENGTVIPCIMGDLKSDADTDITNTFSLNGCATEFIVTIEELPQNVQNRGNVSKICDEWDSPVEKIVVYENTWEPENEDS